MPTNENQPTETPTPRRVRKAVTEMLDDARGVLEALHSLRAKADIDVTSIAERSKHAFDGLEYINSAKVDVDSVISKANSAIESANKALEEAQTCDEQIQEVLSAAQEESGKASVSAGAAKASAEQAVSYSAKTKELCDIADRVQSAVENYQEALKTLNSQFAEARDKINGLLPAATTAGLAAAFGSRRAGLATSAKIWQTGVLICLGILLSLAIYEVYIAKSFDVNMNAQEVRILVARRVPILGALVWLILYTSRQAGNAKRLEEEYAFKEAISRSFEGYKNQLAEMEAQLPLESPINLLCNNTLQILARPPGRIYDKHRLDVSPLTALAESGPEVGRAFQIVADACAKLKKPV